MQLYLKCIGVYMFSFHNARGVPVTLSDSEEEEEPESPGTSCDWSKGGPPVFSEEPGPSDMK